MRLHQVTLEDPQHSVEQKSAQTAQLQMTTAYSKVTYKDAANRKITE